MFVQSILPEECFKAQAAGKHKSIQFMDSPFMSPILFLSGVCIGAVDAGKFKPWGSLSFSYFLHFFSLLSLLHYLKRAGDGSGLLKYQLRDDKSGATWNYS